MFFDKLRERLIYLFGNVSVGAKICKGFMRDGAKIRNRSRLLKYNSTDKIFLLISHEASLTGAPIALLSLGEVLINRGFKVIYLTPKSGPLISIIKKKNIPIVIYERLNTKFLQTRRDAVFWLKDYFYGVVCNTIITAPTVDELNKTQTKVVWWIHEAKQSYSETYKKYIPDSLSKNIRVISVSDYADSTLKMYREYDTDVMYYPLKDCTNFECVTKNKIKKFACVGTLQHRKGQDILLKAIELLKADNVYDFEIVFVGQSADQEILDYIQDVKKQYKRSIKYVSSIEPENMESFYNSIDCLICPSRDDPFPLVITEACRSAKPIIYSEEVGSSLLLKKYDVGLVYKNNSIEELKTTIEKFITLSEEEIKLMGTKSRNFYLDNFYEDKIADKFLSIFNGIDTDFSVRLDTLSIVIPTFNAGCDFERNLDVLKKQKGFSAVEIVVVDSGSTDETLTFARKAGCKIIEIPKSEFSHSYARNLGIKATTSEVVIVMTQDACPSSYEWARNMVIPLSNTKIAASTCTEKYPESADPFYKINSRNHCQYLMKNQGLSLLVEDGDGDILRKSAINDVACALNKKIFNLFKYSGEYAEDLFLGLNLLKKGYCLKFIYDNHVIHGHNRSCDYYFRRGYVESKTFFKNDLTPSPVFDDNRVLLYRTAFVLFSKLSDMTYNAKDPYKSILLNIEIAKANLSNKEESYKALSGGLLLECLCFSNSIETNCDLTIVNDAVKWLSKNEKHFNFTYSEMVSSLLRYVAYSFGSYLAADKEGCFYKKLSFDLNI